MVSHAVAMVTGHTFPHAHSLHSCADGLEQIAVDQSRQLLYTRSTKGSLVVFDLGKEGEKMTQVASVTQEQIVQRAVQCTRCDAGRECGVLVDRQYIHSYNISTQ